MTVEISPITVSERKEAIQKPPTPKWLTGIWEVGGCMTFQYLKKIGHLYSYPYISITDNNLETSHYLFHYFCPDRTPQMRGYSAGWRLTGNKAVEMAVPLLPYSVRRKEVIKTYMEWRKADSRDLRTAIAQDFTTKQPKRIAPQEYYPLIEDPEILAGIIDGRGNIYHHNKPTRNESHDHFTMPSDNLSLLLALQYRYGGSCHTNFKENEQGEITSKTHSWEIDNSEGIQKVMNIVSNYLRFPDKVEYQ